MSYGLLLGSQCMIKTAGCLPNIYFPIFLSTHFFGQHYSLVWPQSWAQQQPQQNRKRSVPWPQPLESRIPRPQKKVQLHDGRSLGSQTNRQVGHLLGIVTKKYTSIVLETEIHFGSISASSLGYSKASCHLAKHSYLADTLFEALQPKENLEEGVAQNFQFPNPV